MYCHIDDFIYLAFCGELSSVYLVEKKLYISKCDSHSKISATVTP